MLAMMALLWVALLVMLFLGWADEAPYSYLMWAVLATMSFIFIRIELYEVTLWYGWNQFVTYAFSIAAIGVFLYEILQIYLKAGLVVALMSAAVSAAFLGALFAMHYLWPIKDVGGDYEKLVAQPGLNIAIPIIVIIAVLAGMLVWVLQILGPDAGAALTDPHNYIEGIFGN